MGTNNHRSEGPTRSHETHPPELESIAAIVPARNEQRTVAEVVEAAIEGLGEVGVSHSVTVVSDGSVDATAEEARRAGASVVSVVGPGSKAHALRIGLERTTSSHVMFLDADLVGLTSAHIQAMVEPVRQRRVLMSVGTFDYERAAWWVERVPWSTGQRLLPRSVFDYFDPRLDGYNAELLINEYVGSAGGLTASQRLHGLRQRNKSEKFSSRREGWMGNMRMWTQIVQSSHPLDRAAYWSYMAGVRVPDADGNLPDRPHLVALGAYPTIGLGAAALRGASRPFR